MKKRNWTMFMVILVVVDRRRLSVSIRSGRNAAVEDVAAAFEAAWNEGDVDALDAIAAPDLVVHDPPGPDLVGLDAYKRLRG